MSRLEVREVTDESGLRGYDRLNRESPQGGVFSCRGFLRHLEIDTRCVGVFKGTELVAGCLVPVASGKVLRVVPSVPWTGPIARSSDEGENLAAAEGLAGYLLRAFGEATLTMPPEWIDVRGFTWAGFRSHVRYTYRYQRVPEDWVERYEGRVRVPSDWIDWQRQEDRLDGFILHRLRRRDAEAVIIEDTRMLYYLSVPRGTGDHTGIIHASLHHARAKGLGFDWVGCNSPKRGLFKRAFGGCLTPYYVVTTADPKEIAEFWPPQEAAVA